jgi:glutamate-5-semialdehyde dehydrogenase
MMNEMAISTGLLNLGINARTASKELAKISSRLKNKALEAIAEILDSHHDAIIQANRKDLEAGNLSGLTEVVLDRLMLDANRLREIRDGVLVVASLADPVGEEFDSRMLANGLRIARRRTPLGVIGSIYESRPNVTVDIASLCLKSGNACVLRGGSESVHSNIALAMLIRKAIGQVGIPEDCVQILEDQDRTLITQMLKMRDYFDLLIPRGGADLIRFVGENALMPVVTGGIGVCHLYVDKTSDLEMAKSIIRNAKVQRPTVCNALDTVLIHSSAAPDLLPDLVRILADDGVELRCDSRSLSLLGEETFPNVIQSKKSDWGNEFLSLVLAVRIVDHLDEALEHIGQYGGHSEAIITNDYEAAQRFLNEVDSAAVFVNASTRFNDGGQFGLGAEVAISTNKLHARGPMGLRELTSYKWVVQGTGQVRE